MNITTIRTIFTDYSTEGVLLINNKQFCYTLEDPVRQTGSTKIYGKTAIPAGRYPFSLFFWDKHKDWYPPLDLVPGFTGIFLHGGVTPEDTLGCVLTMYHLDSDHAASSNAIRDIVNLVKARPKDEKHFIELINSYPYYGLDTAGKLNPNATAYK